MRVVGLKTDISFCIYYVVNYEVVVIGCILTSVRVWIVNLGLILLHFSHVRVKFIIRDVSATF